MYRHCPPGVQRELQKSREKEWQTWQQFKAAKPTCGKELDDLIAEGHDVIPMQWIEVDKNEARDAYEEETPFHLCIRAD